MEPAGYPLFVDFFRPTVDPYERLPRVVMTGCGWLGLAYSRCYTQGIAWIEIPKGSILAENIYFWLHTGNNVLTGRILTDPQGSKFSPYLSVDG